MVVPQSVVQHWSIVLMLSGSTIGGVTALAQWAVPDATVNPYAWIAGGLCLALGFVFKLYDKARSESASEIGKRADRAEKQTDGLAPLVQSNTKTLEDQTRTVGSLVSVVDTGLTSAVAAAQNNGVTLARIESKIDATLTEMRDEIKAMRRDVERLSDRR